MTIAVLLTGAGRRANIVRWFREAGARTIAIDSATEVAAAGVCDLFQRAPLSRSDEYVPWLLAKCQEHEVRLVVPLTDHDLDVLPPRRSEFDRLGSLLLGPPPERATAVADKLALLSDLKPIGIGYPLTFATSGEAFEAVERGDVAWPMFIKPRFGSGSTAISVARDEASVRDLVTRVDERLSSSSIAQLGSSVSGPRVVIQAQAIGPEFGLDVYNDLDGGFAGLTVRRKIAMRAGETDRATIVDPVPFQALAEKLSGYARHRGVLDVDVIWDEDHGPQVIDINPRFGGGYPFSHAAGANLPAALVEWRLGRKPSARWLGARIGFVGAKADDVIPIPTIPGGPSTP